MGHFPFDASFTATFEKPALFIRGTRSHYVTDDMVPTIRRFFPNFQLEDIDSGHWVVSEQPELFCKGRHARGYSDA